MASLNGLGRRQRLEAKTNDSDSDLFSNSDRVASITKRRKVTNNINNDEAHSSSETELPHSLSSTTTPNDNNVTPASSSTTTPDMEKEIEIQLEDEDEREDNRLEHELDDVEEDDDDDNNKEDEDIIPGIFAGKLKSVTMINFMCHSNLTISFGPKINFVIGRNGSGKSAVLTAIMMGLGGRASDTNRAHGIGDVVKEGHNKASVRITFDNSGSMAFRPEKYGSEFTVERAISRNDIKSGNSMFFIYPENGKKFKCLKKDLEEVLSVFSIDIDNQFAILTQDQARSFLVAKKPSDKFELLMKGLRINQTKALTLASAANIHAIKVDLDTKDDDLIGLEKKKKEWEAKKNNNLVVEETSRQISHYKGMGLWHHADKQQEKVDQLGARIQELEAEILEQDSQLDIVGQSKVQLEKEYEEWFASKNRVDLDRLRIEAELQTARENQNEIEDEINKIRDSEKAVNQQKNNSLRMEKEIKAELDKLQNFSSSDNGELSLSSKLERINAELLELDEKSETLNREQDSRQSQIINGNERVKELEGTRASLQSRLRVQKSQLQDLIKGQTSIKDSFGQAMEFALNDIKAKSSSFHNQPIGPLGVHVSLKSPEWSPLLERFMRYTLESFWVTDNHDRNILLGILKKHKMSNSIVVKQRDIYDYRDSLPDKEYTSILDVLEFSDEGIKRLLIDNHNIQKILLIEDRAKADKVMYQKPRNANFAFARQKKDGRDTRHGFQIGTAAKGSSSTNFLRGTYDSEPPRMRVDIGYRKSELERSIRELEEGLNDVNNKIQEEKTSGRDVRDQSKRIIRQLDDIKRTKHNLIASRDSLEAEIEDLTDNAKVARLKGQVDMYQEQIKTYEQQFVGLRNSRVDKNEELETAKTLVSKLRNHLSSVSDELKEKEVSNECFVVILVSGSFEANRCLENRTASTSKNGILGRKARKNC